MKHLVVEKLARASAAATLVALALMVVSIVWPGPYLIVLMMSVGQVVGTLSLGLFLFAIAVDLRQGRGGAPPG